MRPRSDVSQRLIDFSLDVLPAPTGLSDCTELDGNFSSTMWFDDQRQTLCLLATSNVETLVTNPFVFIITDPNTCNVPVAYSDNIIDQLNPYRRRIDKGTTVDKFTDLIIRESGNQTVRFLSELAAKISTSFEIVFRRTGKPFEPAVTLRRGQGACRDLSLLFIDACRSLGLASRFVSGYTQGLPTGDDGELHSWAEVYLPGTGWRGFDPTLGLAVADKHVAVAASPDPEGAAPVVGTFRGDSAMADMRYEVLVTAS